MSSTISVYMDKAMDYKSDSKYLYVSKYFETFMGIMQVALAIMVFSAFCRIFT